MAHYEPNQVVINLTKTRGAGSLAHEWFHTVDNYFERADNHKGSFVSDFARHRHSRLIKDPSFSTTRSEVLDAFAKLNEAVAKTELYKRSSVLDNTRTKSYWGTAIEMNARAFEWYVKNRIEAQGGQNDYLANIESQKVWDAINDQFGIRKDSYPYPAEAKTIVTAFDNLFKTIETKEENGNIALNEPAVPYGKVNNEKALDWLGITPTLGVSSEINKGLSIAKIIQNFENPSLSDKNS